MFPVLSVIWFGILTSISPCTLATNIAATTYIGKQMNRPTHVLLAGLAYTAGRSTTYMILCIILVTGILSIPFASMFLQEYMNKVLGPVLMIAGLYLIEVISFAIKGSNISSKLAKKFSERGILGAIVLGILFALSFCPVSAALFFGSVVPLALKYKSNISLSIFYGIGTSIPVIISAVILAYGTHLAGKIFDKLTAVEYWLRRVTGGIFILIGIYFCLKYSFGLINF